MDESLRHRAPVHIGADAWLGATVTMWKEGNAEGEVLKVTTDEFGDFWFRRAEGKK